MTKDDFQRLLDTPRQLLSALDRQRQYLLQRAMHRCECIHPDCDRRLNQVEACEQGFEGYQLDSASTSNTYRCPDCKTPLKIVVPFFATTSAGWHWGKVTANDPAKRRRTGDE